MPIKVWNGSQWTRKFPKTWDGTRWVEGEMRIWDGSKWVLDYEPQPVTVRHTDTWNASWSETFNGDGRRNEYNSRSGKMYQGKYGKYDTVQGIVHNPILYGIQRSMFGFDYRNIQEKIKGADIEKVEVYLYMDHSWYVAQGKAALVAHNATSKPSTFSHVSSIGETTYYGRDKGMWIDINTSYGKQLATGAITGFGLYKNSEDPTYYTFWNGAGQTNGPKLRITYSRTTYPVPGTNTDNKNDVVVPTSFDHTVVAGDTLWGISTKYNVTLGNLYDWNNLTSSTIIVGQKIKIYSSAAPDRVTASKQLYTTVRAGEGPVNVCERLMVQGLLPQDFETAYARLRTLNGWTVRHPMLHPGDLIMYDKGK